MVTSDDKMEQSIISQVEYYFGDHNLKMDKFMKNEMSQNDGWFPLDKLMTFNRLKKLTTDLETVVSCIKKSTSGLIELNEDGTKIHRVKPVPEHSEEYIKDLNLRTIHLKGFPKDSILDDIMKFCSEFGKVETIQMRRNFRKGSNGEFKGCIMVTYELKEDADKILEQDIKYDNLSLLKENKEKYFERKKNFFESIKKKKEKNADDVVKTKGAILKISGLKQDTKYSDIKEELSKHSKVAFVSSVNEQSECDVRFVVENGAKEAFEAIKKEAGTENAEADSEKLSVELNGQKVLISLATEEQEKEFWREFQSKQSNSNKKNKWQKGKKRFNNDYSNSRSKKFKSGGDDN